MKPSFLITFLIFQVLGSVLIADDHRCGATLSAAVMFNDKKSIAQMNDAFYSKEEFCDSGTREVNANVKVQLLDKQQKILNEKEVFINNFSILEKVKSKKSSKISHNKIVDQNQYRNLNFSLVASPESVATYKILRMSDQSVIGTGALSVHSEESVGVKK